ncbi:urease accessory protein UreD [Thermus scotoductus]|uniref:urease accessory protein UreD n=1 Tax=Thermus scotoductus TaxID=37636 RepID=UPI00156241D3|nr:urease accessory protein UreD [Thermus scotoductus]
MKRSKRPGPKRRHALSLTFAHRYGRTVLEEIRFSGVMKVIRPLEVGDRVLVQLITLGPGLMDGDLAEIWVRVGPGSKAIVLAQSAGKVCPGLVRQRVHLEVEEGGELEYYPGLTILFPGGGLFQEVEASLASTARLGLMEVWALGRTGRGEAHDFFGLETRTLVDQKGLPLYRDALRLTPLDASLPGVLEGRPYLAAGFWTWEGLPPGRGRALAWSLTHRGHTVVRGLGRAEEDLPGEAAGFLLWARAQWGLPPVDLQRFSSAWVQPVQGLSRGETPGALQGVVSAEELCTRQNLHRA